MPHLQSFTLKIAAAQREAFPFNLPLLQKLQTLEFSSAMTFLVGENGSGKSTLLEGLAAAVGSITIGAEDIRRDHTLAHARNLAKCMKLTWHKRTTRGLFLRAEDFFNFSRRMNQLHHDLQEMKEEYEGRLSGYGLQLAQGSAEAQRRAIVERYGEDADAASHGEGFLRLFEARFVPGGLYILDEPEAPLSPIRQLAFMSMLKEMLAQNAQFIIATHSPILMAFPGATILSLDHLPLRSVQYHELEHVTLTRDFLNNPEAFLRRL